MKTNRTLLAAASAIAMSAAHSNAPKSIIGEPRADGPVTTDDLMKAFEAFKAKHAEEIGAKVEDSLLTQHVDRINAEITKITDSLDAQAQEIAAAKIGADDTGEKLHDADYTEAFGQFMAKNRLSQEVEANLNKGADDEGGYLAPVEWDRTITDQLVIINPMRRLCRTQKIGGNGFSKLFNNKGTLGGWVDEAEARPETATGTFGTMAYKAGEMYANPAATQGMLDDSEINLESWLAGEVEEVFAGLEATAFISGDGLKDKPTGLLNYITGAPNAADHPFGAITTVNSGDANLITSDGIIELIYELPAAYQQNASFIMNRKTVRDIRKLKDGNGNYLWQPTYVKGEPATLGGYSLNEVEDMPDIAAAAKPILFGDFNRGYLIIDRTGTRLLRDPYTNKPYVMFYTTRRVGGGLLNPNVFKALNVSV